MGFDVKLAVKDNNLNDLNMCMLKLVSSLWQFGYIKVIAQSCLTYHVDLNSHVVSP
jgi:hypothetical protein